MKFKIDENLPVEISEMLTDADYDSKTVKKLKVSDLFIPYISHSRPRLPWSCGREFLFPSLFKF